MDASKPQIEAALAPFLQGQRWFGGKARGLKAVRIVDWRRCRANSGGPDVRGSGTRRRQTDLYFVPLTDGAGRRAGRCRRPGGGGRPRRLAGRDRGRAGIDHPRRPRPRLSRPPPSPSCAAGRTRRVPAVLAPPTSSNSLMYGRRLLLKVFRRLEPGINPDFEIGRFLTEKSGFHHVPRVAGGVEYLRPGSAPMTLAILQELVAHRATAGAAYAWRS